MCLLLPNAAQRVRLNVRLGLAIPKQLIESKPDVFRYLTEQDGRNVATLMERHRRASAVHISKLLVRTSLTDFRKTECSENGDDLTRLKNRDVTHRLRNCDILHANKLRL